MTTSDAIPEVTTYADAASCADAAALVITLIAPRGVQLPDDVVDVLREADARPVAMRRLAPLEVNGETAAEYYLENAHAAPDLRGQLRGLADRWGIDVTLLPAATKRPRRRLFAFDMDSTLIECEVIDELARRAGVGAQVAKITARAMRGELDFRASFTERMRRLKGLPEPVLQEVAQTLPLMGGARALLLSLRSQGHYTVILSGGFDYFARCVQQSLLIDEVHANTLQIRNGVLTGDVIGDIVDGDRKRTLLGAIAEREGFALEDTVAVGDGANDLPMLAAAGVGVAIHAKPVVREQAPCAISLGDLTSLLHVLGLSSR